MRYFIYERGFIRLSSINRFGVVGWWWNIWTTSLITRNSRVKRLYILLGGLGSSLELISLLYYT